MERSIERFLDSERSLGAVESSGCFTLDASRARLKLGEFQLRDRSFWMLKLVQAAVGSQAGSLDITLGRQVTSARFVPGQEVSPSQLVDCLREPQGARGWLADLAMALNAAMGTRPRSIMVSARGREHAWTLRARDDVVELFPSSQSGDPGWSVAVQRRRRWLGMLGSTPAEVAAVHRAVAERCRFCPIVLRVDGRTQERQALPIDWRLHPGGVRASRSTKLLFLAQAQPEANRALAGVRPTATVADGRTSDDGSACDTLYFHQTQGEPEALVAIPLGLRGPGSLSLVQSGVILETKTVELGVPGAVVVVDAPELAVDLSGFQVVQNPDYHRLLDRVRDELALLVRQAMVHLDLLDNSLRDFVSYRIGLSNVGDHA